MAGGERRDAGGDGDGKPKVSISRLATLGSQSGLFGREGDIAWLDACWAEGAHVASIVAFGGVGKSALVWDWLRGMQRDGWRRAERAALRVYGWSFYSQGTKDQMTSADQFISAALVWFGDPDPNAGSPWDKGERLARHVKERPTLLVLDGVEPLQWGPGPEEGRIKDPALATLVRELGAQNPGLCLITSRLGVPQAEELSAAKCRRLDLAYLTEEAGEALLRGRGVKGAEEDLRAAVREYSGHSLALALLGSYLEEVAEGDVRRRGEIGPLEEDERLGGHARRVMAAYEQWFDGGPEVGILKLLGLFDRPADEGEIGVLRDLLYVRGEKRWYHVFTGAPKRPLSEQAWRRAVARLRRMGLLTEGDGNTHREELDAHPLVREHFGEQLRREQPDAWREGHRRLYEHLRQKAKPLPGTMEEMAPLYAAVEHGCLAGRHQEVLREVYWIRIHRKREHFNPNKLGAWSSEVAMLSSFFEPPWERLAPGIRETDQALVLNEAGSALKALGRLPEATALLSRALERHVAGETWTEAANSAANLSELFNARGDLDEALAYALRGVELADKSGNAFRRMANRAILAVAMHAMGREAEAISQFEEAERMQKESRPDTPMLYSLPGFSHCEVLLDQGRYSEVLVRTTQTLEWHEEQQWLIEVARDHLSLGRVHLLSALRGNGGDLSEAATHLKQAVEGLRGAGQQQHLPLGLLARAALHTHTRAFALAHKDLDESLSLATRCGLRLHEADAHLGLARLALAESDPAAAIRHLATARAIITETGYHRRDEELAGLETEAREMAKAAPAPVPLPPAPAPPAQRAHTLMTNPQRPLDLGIVVALPEELRELLALAGAYTPHHDADLDSYLFERGPYRCAVTLVGDMGEGHATRVTERLIALWDPGSIVVVGIAAGIHDDLRVGDVHVAPQAVEYMQDAKAAATVGGGFAIVPGAPAYRADPALLAAVRSFEFSQREAYQRWVNDGFADLEELVPDSITRGHLFSGNLVRRDVRLFADGHVATGPVVGAAAAFSAWIRSHDRNVKSLEMESAAVLLAAQTRHHPKRALAIRGISDFGDDRKQALDQVGGGSLRQYAMRNAVRLLWALLDAGKLPVQNPR